MVHARHLYRCTRWPGLAYWSKSSCSIIGSALLLRPSPHTKSVPSRARTEVGSQRGFAIGWISRHAGFSSWRSMM